MRIGLVGAPGSGKTELAEALAAQLGDTDTAIIDGYVADSEQEMNSALGGFAGYLGNVYIALRRYARERSAIEAKHVITCGTLIETAIYTAIYFASADEVLSEEEKAEEAPRVDATMRIMSCLFMDVFGYDHVFYLPNRSSTVDDRFIDRQLQAAIGGFELAEVTTLADAETQVADALAVLGVNEVPAS